MGVVNIMRKQIISGLLAMALVVTCMPAGVSAAKAPKLNKKSVNMEIGDKVVVKIKNGNKKAKVSWKVSGKKIVKLSKKVAKGNKASVTVKAVKAGNTIVKATYKLKKVKKVLNCKVKVAGQQAEVVPTIAPTQVPQTTQPAAPTVQPTATAQPSPTAEPTATPYPMKPIAPFIEDTNYDVPDGYDRTDASVAGVVEDITYPSTVIKEGATVNRKAKVALPKDYDENKKYPVIYMMHGIFGNEGTLAGDRVQNVLWNAIDEGVAEEAILVLPNGCANEAGAGDGFNLEHYSAYDNFLNDFKECLKPYIDENYSTLTDREHTAICGFSMGGRVTLHLGFSLQETFRYVGAFCPAPGIFDFSDMGVSGPGLFAKEDFKLKDEYKDDTLVMIVKGTNDTTVHKFPGEYHQGLVDNEVPHIWYEKEGGHDGGVYKHGMYNFLKRIFKE